MHHPEPYYQLDVVGEPPVWHGVRAWVDPKTGWTWAELFFTDEGIEPPTAWEMEVQSWDWRYGTVCIRFHTGYPGYPEVRKGESYYPDVPGSPANIRVYGHGKYKKLRLLLTKRTDLGMVTAHDMEGVEVGDASTPVAERRPCGGAYHHGIVGRISLHSAERSYVRVRAFFHGADTDADDDPWPDSYSATYWSDFLTVDSFLDLANERDIRKLRIPGIEDDIVRYEIPRSEFDAIVARVTGLEEDIRSLTSEP